MSYGFNFKLFSIDCRMSRSLGKYDIDRCFSRALESGHYYQEKCPDIPKVVVMNAVSLALGLIGNISLLMNFSRSVKYLVSQSVSIIAWLCASALLAAALL